MSHARFIECLDFVLDREGGYSNDPLDRGGETNKGVTQKAYDAYCRDNRLPWKPVSALSNEEVAEFYRQCYWVPVSGDRMPNGIDLFLFDSAVQHGARKAIQLLQRALGITDDGMLGPETTDALRADIRAGSVQSVLAECMLQRRQYYTAIINNDPTQGRFKMGWNNRMIALGHAFMGVA